MKSREDGLPVPFEKTGNDSNNKAIFRKGDIFRRINGQNCTITFNQWTEILVQHDEVVRERERTAIDALAKRLTSALSGQGKLPPLVADMSEESLITSLTALFDRNETASVKRFIIEISNLLKTNDKYLYVLSGIASYGIEYKKIEIVNSAVDKIFSYLELNKRQITSSPNSLLKIIVAIYAIGATAARCNQWDIIDPLVNKPIDEHPGYAYASWIRYCQVFASRAGLTAIDNGRGGLISFVLEAECKHSILHPDVVLETQLTQSIDEKDQHKDSYSKVILNSICIFDFLYCICVFANGDGHGDAYPSCAAYSESRVYPIYEKLFGKKEEMRRALLPSCDDVKIAEAAGKLLYLINNEALSHSHYYWSLSDERVISDFIGRNPNSNRI